jgi:YggT family protein
MLDFIYYLGIIKQFFQLLIFIRVILSWLPLDRENAFVDYVYSLTEPILKIFYPISVIGFIDLSPIFAYFAMDIVYSLIVKLLLL